MGELEDALARARQIAREKQSEALSRETLLKKKAAAASQRCMSLLPDLNGAVAMILDRDRAGALRLSGYYPPPGDLGERIERHRFGRTTRSLVLSLGSNMTLTIELSGVARIHHTYGATYSLDELARLGYVEWIRSSSGDDHTYSIEADQVMKQTLQMLARHIVG